MQLAKHKLPVPRRRPAREAHGGTVTMGGEEGGTQVTSLRGFPGCGPAPHCHV